MYAPTTERELKLIAAARNEGEIAEILVKRASVGSPMFTKSSQLPDWIPKSWRDALSNYVTQQELKKFWNQYQQPIQWGLGGLAAGGLLGLGTGLLTRRRKRRAITDALLGALLGGGLGAGLGYLLQPGKKERKPRLPGTIDEATASPPETPEQRANRLYEELVSEDKKRRNMFERVKSLKAKDPASAFAAGLESLIEEPLSTRLITHPWSMLTSPPGVIGAAIPTGVMALRDVRRAGLPDRLAGLLQRAGLSEQRAKFPLGKVSPAGLERRITDKETIPEIQNLLKAHEAAAPGVTPSHALLKQYSREGIRAPGTTYEPAEIRVMAANQQQRVSEAIKAEALAKRTAVESRRELQRLLAEGADASKLRMARERWTDAQSALHRASLERTYLETMPPHQFAATEILKSKDLKWKPLQHRLQDPAVRTAVDIELQRALRPVPASKLLYKGPEPIVIPGKQLMPAGQVGSALQMGRPSLPRRAWGYGKYPILGLAGSAIGHALAPMLESASGKTDILGAGAARRNLAETLGSEYRRGLPDYSRLYEEVASPDVSKFLSPQQLEDLAKEYKPKELP